jgi:hypothetical protein
MQGNVLGLEVNGMGYEMLNDSSSLKIYLNIFMRRNSHSIIEISL